MNESWPIAIKFVLDREGGYVNDPDDPGGETNRGVCKRSHPNLDIKNLTEEQTEKIYFDEYWIPAGCDKLSWPWDIMALDTAVLDGRGNIPIFTIDPKTHQHERNWSDYLFNRIKHYFEMRNKYPKYAMGWVNRTLELHEYIDAINQERTP